MSCQFCPQSLGICHNVISILSPQLQWGVLKFGVKLSKANFEMYLKLFFEKFSLNYKHVTIYSQNGPNSIQQNNKKIKDNSVVGYLALAPGIILRHDPPLHVFQAISVRPIYSWLLSRTKRENSFMILLKTPGSHLCFTDLSMVSGDLILSHIIN